MSGNILDFLSALGDQDEGLFKQVYPLTTSDASYEKSWAFMKFPFSPHSMRYFDGESFFVLNCTPDSGGWRTILIKPHDVKKTTKALELSHELCRMKDVAEVAIRYVYQDELSIFTQYREFVVENRYPQIIYNLKALLLHSGRSWASFRLRLNRFANEYATRYTIVSLKEGGKTMALDAIDSWANSFSSRHTIANPDFVPDKWWYSKVIDYFLCSKLDEDVAIIVVVDDQPRAFGCASPLSPNCAAIYSNIAATDYKGLPEFLLYQLTRELSEKGFTYANIGHSTRESEHRYKSKVVAEELRPVYILRRPGMGNGNRYLRDLINVHCGTPS